MIGHLLPALESTATIWMWSQGATIVGQSVSTALHVKVLLTRQLSGSLPMELKLDGAQTSECSRIATVPPFFSLASIVVC